MGGAQGENLQTKTVAVGFIQETVCTGRVFIRNYDRNDCKTFCHGLQTTAVKRATEKLVQVLKS